MTGFVGVLLVPTVVASLMYVVLFIRSIIRQPTLNHLTGLLLLWQTQTGAAFALAAALIGAIVVVRQTTAIERRAEERRARRANALRAVLPLMLSEISDYASRSVSIFAEVLDPPNAQALRAANLPWQWPKDQQVPAVPSGFVELLTDLVEAICPDDAPSLVVLIKRVQMQHARAIGLQQDILSLSKPTHQQINVVGASHVMRCVVDAVEILARCEALFPYARGQMSPPVAVTVDDIQRAAFLTVPANMLDEVAQEIDRRTGTGMWPE